MDLISSFLIPVRYSVKSALGWFIFLAVLLMNLAWCAFLLYVLIRVARYALHSKGVTP